MGQPTVRVLLYDDNAVVREGLRRLIEENPDLEVVGEAATPGEAGEKFEQAHADVAIVDVRATDDGVEMCRDMLSRHPEVKCLVLTAFDDEGALLDSLLAGAAGYLREQAGSQELATAIRAAASGEWLLKEAVAARARRSDGDDDQVLAMLSAQERRVLELIAEGLTNREIASRMRLSRHRPQLRLEAAGEATGPQSRPGGFAPGQAGRPTAGWAGMTIPAQEYTLLGDTNTGVLVNSHGSIDLRCPNRFESEACLAALDGDAYHGWALVAAVGGPPRSRRRYRGGTLILEADIGTKYGTGRAVDLSGRGLGASRSRHVRQEGGFACRGGSARM